MMEKQSNSERLAHTKNRFVAVDLTRTLSKLEYESDMNSREYFRTKRNLREFLLTVNQTSGYLADKSLGETNGSILTEVANNDTASEDDKKIVEPNSYLRNGSPLESVMKPTVLDLRQQLKGGDKARYAVEGQTRSIKEQRVGTADISGLLVERARLLHIGVSPPCERKAIEVHKIGVPLQTKSYVLNRLNKPIELQERRHSTGNVSDKQKSKVAGILCPPDVASERQYPYSTLQRTVLPSESENKSCNVLLPPTIQKSELRRHSIGGLQKPAISSNQAELFVLKQEKKLVDDRHRDHWRKNHNTKTFKANSGNVRSSIQEGKKQDGRGKPSCSSPVLFGRSSADKQGAGSRRSGVFDVSLMSLQGQGEA